MPRRSIEGRESPFPAIYTRANCKPIGAVGGQAIGSMTLRLLIVIVGLSASGVSSANRVALL